MRCSPIIYHWDEQGTCSRKERDLLMWRASRAMEPCAPVLELRSEPARSTIFSLALYELPSAVPELLVSFWQPEMARHLCLDRMSDCVNLCLSCKDMRPASAVNRFMAFWEHRWQAAMLLLGNTPACIVSHQSVKMVWERDDLAFSACPATALLLWPCIAITSCSFSNHLEAAARA